MIRINFFLTEKQLDFLKDLPGTVSENIRIAVNEYIQKLKGENVSASQSKVGELDD